MSKTVPTSVASQHMLTTAPPSVASQLESTMASRTVGALQHTQHGSTAKTACLSSTKPLQQVTLSLDTKGGSQNDAKPKSSQPTDPAVSVQHTTKCIPTLDDSKLHLHDRQCKQVTSITASVNQAKQSKIDVLKMINGNRKAKPQLTFSELVVENIGGVKWNSEQKKQSQASATRKGADVAAVNKNLMVLVRKANDTFSLKTLQEHNKDLVKKPDLPFKCFFCQRQFKTKSKRRIHIFDKHDLCCQYCPTTCEDERALALHEVKCHISKDVIRFDKGEIGGQEALTGPFSVDNGDKTKPSLANDKSSRGLNASIINMTGKNRNGMHTMGNSDVQQDRENIPIGGKSQNIDVMKPASMEKTTKSPDVLTQNTSATASANEGRLKQAKSQTFGHITVGGKSRNVIDAFPSTSMGKTTKSQDILIQSAAATVANEGRFKQANLQSISHIRDKSGNVLTVFPSSSMGKITKSTGSLTKNMSITAANAGRLNQVELQPSGTSRNMIGIVPSTSVEIAMKSASILPGNIPASMLQPLDKEDGEEFVNPGPTSSAELLAHMKNMMAHKNLSLTVRKKVASFLLDRISKIDKEEREMKVLEKIARSQSGSQCKYCLKEFPAFYQLKYHEAMHDTRRLLVQLTGNQD